jgi:hypothetical protein
MERAKTSISPVGRLAFTAAASRAFTVPSMVTTDSSFSFSRTGSASLSLSATIWVIP